MILAARHATAVAMCAFSLAVTAAQAAGAAAKNPDTAYADAQRAFDDGDCNGAIRAFAAAYRLRPHPRALLHIGHCYRKLGDLDSAAGAYALIVDRHEGSPLARRARDLLLVVEGERARAAKEGKPVKRTVSPLLDELAQPLDRAEPVAPPREETREPPFAEPPGEKVASVESGPLAAPVGPAKVAAPAGALEAPAPSAAASRTRSWTWVAAGGAALALGAGGYYALSASSTKNQFETQVENRVRKDELAAQYDQQKSRATTLFIAGGVLAAAAGALFIVRF